eukprot:16391-Heterococcus_DN1.PRE.2
MLQLQTASQQACKRSAVLLLPLQYVCTLFTLASIFCTKLCSHAICTYNHTLSANAQKSRASWRRQQFGPALLMNALAQILC